MPGARIGSILEQQLEGAVKVFSPSNMLLSAVVALGALGLAGAGFAQEVDTDEKPGYFQFFMKNGKFETIKEEAERNEQIAAGELTPREVNEPVPNFKLPDGFGNSIGLRDYVGEKNVVLSTMRTWW